MSRKRIGFFTRLLDDVPPAERYRLAAAQIRHAEAHGYHTAWVAQHHFHEAEGGLPAPFPFLSYVAAQTLRIRLGTGVVTLTMEDPIRVAEDAVVTDLLSGGRLELGVGSGGTPSSFTAFGHEFAERRAIYGGHLARLRKVLGGQALPGENRIYPSGLGLGKRIWQATFSVDGGIKAGLAGDGLLLSRTQPRPEDTPLASLADLQLPIIEAYLDHLPKGTPPRILASRSVFVADDRSKARAFAETGLRKVAAHFQAAGHAFQGDTLDDLIAAMDTHVGTPDEVAASLAADRVLDHATEIAVQVHSVDPPHEFILRSIELFATRVAPALGWIDPPHALRLRAAAV